MELCPALKGSNIHVKMNRGLAGGVWGLGSGVWGEKQKLTAEGRRGGDAERETCAVLRFSASLRLCGTLFRILKRFAFDQFGPSGARFLNRNTPGYFVTRGYSVRHVGALHQ